MTDLTQSQPRSRAVRSVVALAARVATLAAMALPAIPASAADISDRISGAIGGIVRYPNDLQPESEGNLFGEAWAKVQLSLHKGAKTDTAFFFLGNFVADSTGFAYNNTAKGGLGFSHSIQASDKLNITLSGRYDWFMERTTDLRQQGIRLAADYYYYQRWEAAPDATMFGLGKMATIFKSYGTLAHPGSLLENDDNIVLTLGGELSADLDLPKTEWILTPFADFDFAWDKDENNYNNKLVTGVGLKGRYPLDKGELFAGVRMSSDVRWINDTHNTGPAAYFGWYKGF